MRQLNKCINYMEPLSLIKLIMSDIKRVMNHLSMILLFDFSKVLRPHKSPNFSY